MVLREFLTQRFLSHLIRQKMLPGAPFHLAVPIVDILDPTVEAGEVEAEEVIADAVVITKAHRSVTLT